MTEDPTPYDAPSIPKRAPRGVTKGVSALVRLIVRAVGPDGLTGNAGRDALRAAVRGGLISKPDAAAAALALRILAGLIKERRKAERAKAVEKIVLNAAGLPVAPKGPDNADATRA